MPACCPAGVSLPEIADVRAITLCAGAAVERCECRRWRLVRMRDLVCLYSSHNKQASQPAAAEYSALAPLVKPVLEMQLVFTREQLLLLGFFRV